MLKKAKKKIKAKPRKRRIYFKRLVVALLLLYCLVFIGMKIINVPIKNIYIENNSYLSDQQIIDIAKVGDYPSVLSALNISIKNRLEHNIYIQKANVYKKNLTELHISVIENRPIFFNKSTNMTVLQDGRTVKEKLTIATLINYVPDITYAKLIKEMALITPDVVTRISEIEYRPNDVDDSRFLMSMNDGNYVYLTLNKFDSINSYIDIIKKFNNKKGILYLDSGEYFEIMEN